MPCSLTSKGRHVSRRGIWRAAHIGLAVWPSKDAVNSVLAATQAIGAEKAPMAEGCLVIGGSLAVQGLAELLGYVAVEEMFTSGSPWLKTLAGSSSFFPRVGQATSTLLSPFLFVQNRTQGGTTVVIYNHESTYENWSGYPGVPVPTQYTVLTVGRSRIPSRGHPTVKTVR